MSPKMHEDEIDVDAALVRELLRRQFPDLADMPLARVASQGTVNAIYRVGDELVLRLPLTPRWHDIDLEACWLDALASKLPVRIPELVAIGESEDIYPWKFGVLRWLDGAPWAIDAVDDPVAAAAKVAELIVVLRDLDLSSLPLEPYTRAPLPITEDELRAELDRNRHLIDPDAFLAAWNTVLAGPEFAGELTLCHGDLLAANVLVHKGQLHAVIDWAGFCRADPAHEVMAAWTLFSGEARTAFRRALAVDDDTWSRAKGWALTRIFNVAYYEKSNPLFSLDARRTIAEVLADAS